MLELKIIKKYKSPNFIKIKVKTMIVFTLILMKLGLLYFMIILSYYPEFYKKKNLKLA